MSGSSVGESFLGGMGEKQKKNHNRKIREIDDKK